MTMNVRQLRELLDYYEDDVEVRLMSQSSWPFEYSVLGSWRPMPEDDGPDACDTCGLTQATHFEGNPDTDDHSWEPYGEEHFLPSGKSPLEVLYLVEGEQLGYGTKAAFEEAELAF